MTRAEWDEAKCYDEDECYLVQAIRKHLITCKQKQELFTRDLSVEDILNGRFGETDEAFVHQTLCEWNVTLGWKEFGF